MSEATEMTAEQAPKMYACTANYSKREGEYTRSGQLPTFFLNSHVQGIVSVQHAHDIAYDIFRPLVDATTFVVVNVVEV
jgi:hypothetical protein